MGGNGIARRTDRDRLGSAPLLWSNDRSRLAGTPYTRYSFATLPSTNRTAPPATATITLASPTTGMKLVSPFQRGTMCQCRWPGTPAPATRPRFSPTLKPVRRSSASRMMPTHLPHDVLQVEQFVVVEFVELPLVGRGQTSRWPLLYGKRLSTTTDSAVRWTTRFARSSGPASAAADEALRRRAGCVLRRRDVGQPPRGPEMIHGSSPETRIAPQACPVQSRRRNPNHHDTQQDGISPIGRGLTRLRVRS